MKFCSWNWHCRSQWMPNQVNRASKRKVFDFSGLWAGSQQEQRLEASMANSEGQSTAVPTGPDLCFRLWTAKPACGTSASGAAQEAAGQAVILHLQRDTGRDCPCVSAGRARLQSWGRAGQPQEHPSTFLSCWDREEAQDSNWSSADHTTRVHFHPAPPDPPHQLMPSCCCTQELLQTQGRTEHLLPTLNASRIPVITVQIPQLKKLPF